MSLDLSDHSYRSGALEALLRGAREDLSAATELLRDNDAGRHLKQLIIRRVQHIDVVLTEVARHNADEVARLFGKARADG